MHGADGWAAGAAFYRQAEVFRVLGDFAAAAAIRRVVGETAEEFRRARLLPAQVEIMLAAGDVQAARDAADELAGIADRFATPAVRAMADLLVAGGHPDPERTADLLVALKDGLLVGADLDDPARRGLVRDAVTRLLDGAAGASADAPTSGNRQASP